MLTALSATDVAISAALRAGDLRVTEAWSDRLGEPYWVIADSAGVIEVAMSLEEAETRVASVESRHA